MKNLMHWMAVAVASAMLLGAAAGQEPAQTSPPARPQGEGAGPRRGQRMMMRGTAGTITSIEGDTIKLKTLDGKEATAKIGDKTRFRKDQKDAAAADFKVGDTIFVRGEQSPDGSWAAQNVISRSDISAQLAGGGRGAGGGGPRMMFAEGLGKQFIAGQVKEINGTKLTIERPDNQVQTIEVDENTSFRMIGAPAGGESVTLADIKPGYSVMGRGALNKDGVFVPAVLNISERGLAGPMVIQGPPKN